MPGSTTSVTSNSLVALEYPDQIVDVGKAEGGRIVDGFMHRPMFSGFGAITVQIIGRKTEFFHERLTGKIKRVGADITGHRLSSI